MSSSDTIKVKDAAHLLTEDHAELNESLRGICASLEACDVHDAHARLDLFWASLAVHIRAEHLHLFPAILDALATDAGDGGPARPAIEDAHAALEQLRDDHSLFMRELAEAVNTLRELAQRAAVVKASTQQMESVRLKIVNLGARLAEHNRLEESKVYRWPTVILSQEEQALLADRLRHEIENMPPRFRLAESL